MDICFVFEFYLLLNKASVNILVSGILENIYFTYMLEIYLGMELLDFRIWIGSVLVDTAKEFSVSGCTIFLSHMPWDSSIGESSHLQMNPA